MKNFISIILISYFFFYSMPAKCQAAKGNILYGVFDGRTPCQELAKQLGETTTPACIKIKWRLILYKDSLTGMPTEYSLQGFVYKRENPRIGKWHIIKGTKSEPGAIVYQLDQKGSNSMLFQKGDDNVLFFLDEEKRIMVGNRDFSYTLNRKDNK